MPIFNPILVGKQLPTLTNPGAASDLASGKQLIGQDGEIVTGTADVRNFVVSKDIGGGLAASGTFAVQIDGSDIVIQACDYAGHVSEIAVASVPLPSNDGQYVMLSGARGTPPTDTMQIKCIQDGTYLIFYTMGSASFNDYFRYIQTGYYL